jgi:hypothetical protein
MRQITDCIFVIGAEENQKLDQLEEASFRLERFPLLWRKRRSNHEYLMRFHTRVAF